MSGDPERDSAHDTSDDAISGFSVTHAHCAHAIPQCLYTCDLRSNIDNYPLCCSKVHPRAIRVQASSPTWTEETASRRESVRHADDKQMGDLYEMERDIQYSLEPSSHIDC
jgi:hypothetical protein